MKIIDIDYYFGDSLLYLVGSLLAYIFFPFYIIYLVGRVIYGVGKVIYDFCYKKVKESDLNITFDGYNQEEIDNFLFNSDKRNRK